MKNTVLIITLALITAACAHTGTPTEQAIEKVAYSYCMTASEYKLDSAALYCTQESIDQSIAAGKFWLQYMDSAHIQANLPVTIDIKKIRQTSDTTAFAVYHKKTPRKAYTDTVFLRYRHDRWLIHTPDEHREQKRGQRKR